MITLSCFLLFTIASLHYACNEWYRYFFTNKLNDNFIRGQRRTKNLCTRKGKNMTYNCARQHLYIFEYHRKEGEGCEVKM